MLGRLVVRRDWYKGLAADPVDHVHPDVGDEDKPNPVKVGLSVRLLLYCTSMPLALTEPCCADYAQLHSPDFWYNLHICAAVPCSIRLITHSPTHLPGHVSMMASNSGAYIQPVPASQTVSQSGRQSNSHSVFAFLGAGHLNRVQQEATSTCG